MLAVAGCTNTPPQPDPQLTFQHLPPLTVKAAELVVVDDYAAPGKAPNVEHRFPISPEDALRRWASDRFRTVGGAPRAEFVIQNASVVEEALETDQKLKDIFIKEQGERYTAKAQASLRIITSSGNEIARATALAEQSITVREDSSLHDRETVWFELVEKLMAAFDQEMVTQLRRHLGDYVN